MVDVVALPVKKVVCFRLTLFGYTCILDGRNCKPPVTGTCKEWLSTGCDIRTMIPVKINCHHNINLAL